MGISPIIISLIVSFVLGIAATMFVIFIIKALDNFYKQKDAKREERLVRLLEEKEGLKK